MPPTPSAASRDLSARRWLLPGALFLISFLVFGATISHTIFTTDVFGANWTSWHVARTGSPWIDGTAQVPEAKRWTAQLLAVQTHQGHAAYGRFPGVVVASIPAYLLAGSVGSAGFSTVPGSLTAAFLTACALVLMLQALRRYLTDTQALIATLVFGLATPVWTVSANLMWPHTITVLGIAGMAWASASGRWWWVGVFGGIGLCGRVHVAIIVAVLGLGVSIRRREWGPAVRVALASGGFLVASSFWIHWVYGTWNPLGAYGGGDVARTADQYRYSLVNQLGMWVAPDRGILVWTPVALVLLPALVRSWRELPDWSRSLLVGGLVYTLVGGAMNTFTGGDGFYGYRYGLELLACATPALALSQQRMGRLARACLGPVVAAQLFAFLVGAVRNNAYLTADEAWRHNAFVHTMDTVGAGGWVAFAVVVVAGWWTARRLQRRGVTAPAARESVVSGSPA